MGEEFAGLSTRARNALLNYGFTTRADVLAAAERGPLPMRRGFGKKSEAEVRRWLVLPEYFAPANPIAARVAKAEARARRAESELAAVMMRMEQAERRAAFAEAEREYWWQEYLRATLGE